MNPLSFPLMTQRLLEQPSVCRALGLLIPMLVCVLRGADASAPALSPTDFQITSEFPKYVTAEIEFRDPTGAKWPNFFYGKPATKVGYIRVGSAQPAAAFSLLCDKMVQEKGDQSRKILGDLCLPDKPPVITLTVASMGPITSETKSGNDKGGKDKGGLSTELSGTLAVDARKVPVKVVTNLRHHGGKGDEKHIALMLDGRCTIKAADLGIKSLPAGSLVEVRFRLTAYPAEAAEAKKKDSKP